MMRQGSSVVSYLLETSIAHHGVIAQEQVASAGRLWKLHHRIDQTQMEEGPRLLAVRPSNMRVQGLRALLASEYNLVEDRGIQGVQQADDLQAHTDVGVEVDDYCDRAAEDCFLFHRQMLQRIIKLHIDIRSKSVQLPSCQEGKDQRAGCPCTHKTISVCRS